METPFSPLDGLVVLPSSLPSPGHGVLPVNAFLLRGKEPVLIDAGTALDEADFLDALDSVIDISSIHAVVMTHEDADHTGALAAVLERAQNARLVATPTGFGKLSASMTLDPSRLVVATPGQRVVLGERAFRVLRPPLYDSPATLMLLDERDRARFSSDAFGAFVDANTERVDELRKEDMLDGLSLFSRANSPWLFDIEPVRWRAAIDAVRSLDVEWLFASHLPPAPRRVFDAICARALALPSEGPI